MSWQNYDQILADLKTVVQTVTAFNLVLVDGDERDFNFHHMPMADIRVIKDVPEVRAGQDYVNETTFEIEIVAHSLQKQRDAASLRNSLLRSTIDAIRANPLFSATLESTYIGEVTFASVTDEKTGAFVAAVTFQVITIAYVDRS